MSISRSEACAYNAVAITTSDTTDYNCRALYVGGAGNVVVTMAGDATEITFSNVPAGTILPVQVRKVKTTTTATNIVGLY